MPKVSKEMVDVVRLARWEEWERMAKDMPRGHHILSVELLRPSRNETAIVLTVAQNGRVVQYELRGDDMGKHAKPVISQRGLAGCDRPRTEIAPRAAGLMTMAAAEEEGGPVANGMALGEPPIKEPPHPGVIALGDSLLITTFGLGEQVVPDPSRPE